jgi:uncharacterized membrane protein
VRWLHVITAIAWIGSSFYFIALDLGCTASPTAASAAPMARNGRSMAAASTTSRNTWSRPADARHLTWFKWESYWTWLSGGAADGGLLAGRRALPDRPAKCSSLRPWQAIGISALSLTVGWLVYDRLCKSAAGQSRPG